MIRKIAVVTAAALSLGIGLMVVGTPQAAKAAGYGTIVGTATETNAGVTVREPGAAVWLYRWNGSSWVSLGRQATTNSSGNYAIYNVALGYYYSLAATKLYGACNVGYGAAAYLGSTGYFFDNVPTANAAIHLFFNRWVTC
jgi:hypothetical protein